MSTKFLALGIAGLLLCPPAFAQTKPTDPETDSKKTPQEKGYHVTQPKRKGATPPDVVEEKARENDKDRKLRDRRDLGDQTPPTYQPNTPPPGKP